MKLHILRYETIGSTNTESADHARRGADEGLCIIAREQTAGRGRYGRQWSSGKDAGLYFSIILRPKLDKRSLPLITLMAGIAVHDTLADLGISPDIKWVNDVLVADKKISGILAEAIETSTGIAVIVGIGINLLSGNFPPEIAPLATSIGAETGRMVTADAAAESISLQLSHFYDVLKSRDGPAQIIEHWGRRSTYFIGKDVRVNLDGETIEGTTDGLEENGALRVKTRGGSVRIVQAGDVERLREAVRGE